MDIKEFAQDFQDNVAIAAEMNGGDMTQELASAIIEYIEDSGEVNAPSICTFQKTRARLTAYDYNDEAESLDLFYLIKTDTLMGKVNQGKIHQGFNYLLSFYREAVNDLLLRNTDSVKNDEIEEVAKLVQSTQGKISQLRLYIITDGMIDLGSIPEPEEDASGEFVIEYNVWDIERVYQQHILRAGKEKVEIDFETDYNTKLQCLRMNDGNEFVDAYMAIIPGITLAKIYKRYQQVLLEKNVRTFLQFKGKVNKGIRKTLREEPEMFFSYNNGISTTASEIVLEETDGTFYITKLTDWQIVNGGQTTASIAATMSDKDVDLRKVFVPMKVSVIHTQDANNTIVKAISTYANSQTAIKNSDFSSNDPYLVALEEMSRNEWIPNDNNRPISKWYFERTRGQYLDQLAQLSGLNDKRFRTEYPKSNRIGKTSIAKFHSTWEMRPFDVCRGLEANYSLFVAEIKKARPLVSARYYHHLIAKGILMNTIDEIVKSKKLGGYKAAMVSYIGAAISFLSDGKLDLNYIWERQKVQQEVVDRIEELIPLVWMHLTNSNYPNVLTWTKKPECWTRLKLKLGEFDKFTDKYLLQSTNEEGVSLNIAQKERIEEAESFEADFWFRLAEWLRKHDLLTPMDRKSVYNLGTMRSRNKNLSLKLAQNALRIVEQAQKLGFES